MEIMNEKNLTSGRNFSLKKNSLIWIYFVTLIFFPRESWTGNAGAAESNLELNLEPQIAVEASTPIVTATPPVGLGEFDVSVDFDIEANTKEVEMFAEATDFYYNGELNSPFPSIKLSESAGVDFEPEGASAASATYSGAGNPIDGFPSRKSGMVTSISDSVNNIYQHPVTVTFSWEIDSIMPAGKYNAKVRLTCIAIPPE